MSVSVVSIYQEILGRTDDGERPAILGRDPTSYGELRRRVDRLVRRLSDAGAGPGVRIGLALDPGIGYLVSLLGIRAAGATAVLFGTSWTPFEQRRCFLQAQPTWMLTGAEPAVGETAEAVVACEEADGRLYSFRYSPVPVASDPDDAIIIYTSGTTGAPKGVVLSESAISANVRAVAAYLELSKSDSTAVFTPTCYAYAVSQFLTHALAGAGIFPVPSYLRLPMVVPQACSIHRLTGLAANPTSLRIVLGLDIPPEWDLRSVRYVMSGGQFLDRRLVRRLGERFPNTRIVNMYGASENSPRISYHWVEDRGSDDPARFYPVGIPVRDTRVEIRSDDDRPLAAREVGEVVVSGTSMMRGYWRDPEATAAKLRNGWLHTGDLGFLDEAGSLVLTGRASNVINVGNEKVSPEDVERVLLEVRGVAEAGVYGVPDPVTGESVRAQVVVEPGAAVDPETMLQHCRLMVSGYKVPREVRVVDALPRTLYGKLDRAKLKES
jgi:acyl-CoA synthetase (AMP-forming)/AMP-acid ligase II